MDVSDYERLIELAAKGLAERDNHPMPKSVTTPEAFYEVMARAALVAIGLRELLEEVEVTRAQQELRIPDEAPTCTVNASTATTLDDALPDAHQYTLNAPEAKHNAWEDGGFDARSHFERATLKAENTRLRRKWATTAKEHLIELTAAVECLREVFHVEQVVPSEEDEQVASELVAACGSLSGWLGSTRVPRGLAKAEGELGAAAGVYLNAAIVFRNLKDAEGNQRHARSDACAMLMEQGDHHVDAFVAALAKKLSL